MSKRTGVFLILAAGKGTRMKSPLAKVLHPLCGRPMLCHLLDQTMSFRDMRTVCVIGHDAEGVRAVLPAAVGSVIQSPQRGTGDAVRVARRAFAGARVLVVAPGDAPMVSAGTFRRLLEHHRRKKALATVLTAEPEEPAAYGRVICNPDGTVQRIVEAVDADPETLKVRRINTGIYAFDPRALLAVIGRIGKANRKGEFYLTDAIELLSARGCVASLNTDDPDEVTGINSLAELARLEGAIQKHLRGRLMENGVQIPHPQSVYLEPAVRVDAGARLLPGSHLAGRTVVEAGAVIGPDAFVVDSRIGPRSRIWYSVVEGSVLGENVVVGPFAHLRPKTRLAPGARVGNFVETKAARIESGAKAMHLSYVGDVTIGAGANIGAGTITCNYDGFHKYPTRIGPGAFIGSNASLVAPVTVGAGAVVGAGSVITKNVPADSLALTRAPQTVKPGWAKRRRERMSQELGRRKKGG